MNRFLIPLLSLFILFESGDSLNNPSFKFSSMQSPLSSKFPRQHFSQLSQWTSTTRCGLSSLFSRKNSLQHIHYPLQLILHQQSKTSRDQCRYQYTHGTFPRKSNTRFIQWDFISCIKCNDVANFIKKDKVRYAFSFVFFAQVLAPLSLCVCL